MIKILILHGPNTNLLGIWAAKNKKHITLDKTFKGPDHPFSIEPNEMKKFISLIR